MKHLKKNSTRKAPGATGAILPRKEVAWMKNKIKVLLKIARWIILEIIRAFLEEE